MKQQLYGLLAAASVASLPVHAETLANLSADFDAVEMYLVDETGPGKYIGTVDVRQTDHGVVFEPELSDLDPGLHGFHVHEDASCDPNTKDADWRQVPAGAAGDHYDPRGVDTHKGPYEVSHLGDLPNLYVNEEGDATHPVLAPRLEMKYLQGRSLIVHALPDDYEDGEPNSGARVACGIFFSDAMEDRVKPN